MMALLVKTIKQTAIWKKKISMWFLILRFTSLSATQKHSGFSLTTKEVNYTLKNTVLQND
jgi:hypothetical protein